MKTGRKNTNDFERLVVEHQSLAQNRKRLVKSLRPQRMTDHRNRRPLFIVLEESLPRKAVTPRVEKSDLLRMPPCRLSGTPLPVSAYPRSLRSRKYT
jgi:hypothetical protein